MFALAVSVCQAVAEDAVCSFDVAEFRALAAGGEVVGDVGHGLGSAGHDDGGVARHYCLSAKYDRFKARGTDFVYGCRDGGGFKIGVDGALAGRILTQTEGMSAGLW